jgi:hypothetical protein
MVSVAVLRCLLTMFSMPTLICVRFDEKSEQKGRIDVWRIEGYTMRAAVYRLLIDSLVFTLRGDPLYGCSWLLD